MTRLTSKSLGAAAAALICAAVVGCDPSSPDAGISAPSATSSASSKQAAPTTTTGTADPAADYSRLLLTAADISDEEDTFTVQSTNPGPAGLPGASALFVNQDDTRAISDTIVIYPDAETASRTLRDALPSIGSVVKGASPRPAPVGTDGTLAVGTSPDDSTAATLLLFTQGPALVRLEFQSALGDATTDQFVITIGKMQEIALRTGLPSP
ncbi:hypothetical protein SAMN04489835_2111 [Mycolicibacterium rutilum]|uniref:Lipoprotein LpqN n=1 Tax=Mycolicibacterium rutilum TaxID=370526 RepID=A0A1H6JSM1_MYCRU|nr:hypothetical protein [Mycolicibacterium rutilum]SEH62077.1 hypothetical protein SAMN04489835_2111 [Mycolicibacterium rutilum]